MYVFYNLREILMCIYNPRGYKYTYMYLLSLRILEDIMYLDPGCRIRDPRCRYIYVSIILEDIKTHTYIYNL